MSLQRAVSQPSLVDGSVVEEKDAHIEIMATMTNMIKLEIRPGRYVGACFGSYNWGPMTCKKEPCQCCPSNASMVVYIANTHVARAHSDEYYTRRTLPLRISRGVLGFPGVNHRGDGG